MTKYFTLKELCSSRTAKDLGIDNFPTFQVASNLERLTVQILDPLREAWGSAIRVSSGYRCEALNKAVGGAKASVHRDGNAADLQPVNGRTEDFIKFARQWLDDNHIAYDQLIHEKSGSVIWMHIGIYGPKGQQRRQYLELTV